MTGLALTLALLAAPASAEARYVANAGWLVAVDGARFLIDAPIREGIAPYATSTADERRRLESATAPYDRVDAILVTHWHEDHFSPEAVAAHLRANPRALVVSSPEVIARLRAVAADLPGERLRGVLPAPGSAQDVTVAGTTVRVLRIRHNDARRFPEQHVGFLIGDAVTVLHVGDADPVADNFAVMRTLPRVDLALLPFWYVTSPASRRMVAELIAPRRIAGMHLPPSDASAVAARLRADGVDVVLATAPGQAAISNR
jgi:L-ascorbate metabolism protein UlaG (beta-lactamase superfamily)